MSLTNEQRDNIKIMAIDGCAIHSNDVLALLDALEESERVLAEERQINADNRRQIRGLQGKLATAQETIEQYEQRLEIDCEYDMENNKIVIPKGNRHLMIDGITCRDETIKLQDKALETLRATHQATVEALKWAASELQRKIYAVHFLHSKAGKNVGEVQADQEACERCAKDPDYLKAHSLSFNQRALGDGKGEG